jgi:hypothetical protein
MARSILPQGFERNPQIRTNRGYWQGVAARQSGRHEPWVELHPCRCAHPFDQKYAEGYWIGWYNEPAPKGAII